MNRSVHWRTRTAAARRSPRCRSASSPRAAQLELEHAAAPRRPRARPPPAAPPASAASSSSAGGGTVSASACGTKPGVAATGTPINIGAINTKQPGTDFSDIENMTGAYFACVNANGGINGHPIKYFPVTEQTNPSQIASLAKQLVTSDHVVGMMGNSSIIECSVDAAYWKSVGIDVLGRRHRPRVLLDPEHRLGEHGPALLQRRRGPVRDWPRAPTRSPSTSPTSPAPTTSRPARTPSPRPRAWRSRTSPRTCRSPAPTRSRSKLVNAAGPNGAVVLNFTPPEALLILQAAQKLNLEDRVKYWACSTPCNTDFLATSLGPKWNNKLFVNAELTPLDGNTSQTAQLFQAMLKQYGTNVSGGVGSFSEMGFIDGRDRDARPGDRQGRLHDRLGERRVQGGQQLQHRACSARASPTATTPTHIPNNMDYTVTPNNGKMVMASTGGGCTLISADDPQIAAYRAVAGTAPAVGLAAFRHNPRD